MTETTREFLTIPEVANELKLSEQTIRRCIDATEPKGRAIRPFPGWKLVGGKYMTTRDNLRDWFNAAPDA